MSRINLYVSRSELEQVKRERDEARAEVERLRYRLATIIDEAWDTQPVMSAEELLTWLERRLFEDRQERERLRGAAAYHMRERKALAEQRDAALAELERRLDPGEYEAIYRQIATPRAALAGEASGEAKPKADELRKLLLAFLDAEASMASDCDGVYPDVFEAIRKTLATLRDESHACKLCGGVEWRIRATPGGDFDEVFERCDHQPIKEEPRRRHATKQNGDCADWCRACEDEARARAEKAREP